MATFKTWNDFLNYQGPRESRQSILKSSNLSLLNPKDQRPNIWVSLSDSSLAGESLDYFKQHQSSASISQELQQILKQDIQKISSLSINSSEKSSKLLSTISVFYMKFPKFIYNIGIIQIANCIFSVFPSESDVFTMLVYLCKSIYPKGFFTGSKFFKAVREETKIFAEYAKKLRPKILNSLIIHFKTSNKDQISNEVFEIVMERLAETWFNTLFTTNLMTTDLLRVFDCILIHGFDFCHKFGLALLSKYETFFRDILRQEVKSLDLAKNSDFLIYAGNVAKNKLVNKFEKVPVEQLIKKCLKKENYTSLNRHNIRIIFDENSEILKRIEMIKEFRRHIGGIDKDIGIRMITSLDVYESTVLITRPSFLNFFFKNFSWDLETVVKFFVLFDQKGADCLNLLNIKLAIAMMISGFPDKYEVIFKCLDQQDDNYIYRADFIQILKKLEENLYFRQNFYLKNSESQFNSIEKLEKHEFISILNKNEFCQNLVKLLYFIDDEKFNLQSNNVKVAEEVLFNVTTPSKSPVSGFSENDVDVDDVISLNLEEDIEVIGEKSLEVGIIGNRSSGGSSNPAFVKSKEEFESVKIVKDPDYETSGEKVFIVVEDEEKLEKIEKIEKTEKSEIFNEPQITMSIDSQVEIDQIPDPPRNKLRNGCSRLCTTQPCTAF